MLNPYKGSIILLFLLSRCAVAARSGWLAARERVFLAAHRLSHWRLIDFFEAFVVDDLVKLVELVDVPVAWPGAWSLESVELHVVLDGLCRTIGVPEFEAPLDVEVS